ncbi:hypothetical protein MKX01_039991, partial [Papaver californicum]
VTPSFSSVIYGFSKVETWESRNCMNAIAYFVKISPNIESIFLTVEQFVQVLLKKAIALEKVMLLCYKTDSPDRAVQLMEFKEMLLTYPSASSSVSTSDSIVGDI